MKLEKWEKSRITESLMGYSNIVNTHTHTERKDYAKRVVGSE